ncbi:MAG: hypothetical protein AB8I08_20520 [Sandaracinaceae bacterium]
MRRTVFALLVVGCAHVHPLLDQPLAASEPPSPPLALVGREASPPEVLVGCGTIRDLVRWRGAVYAITQVSSRARCLIELSRAGEYVRRVRLPAPVMAVGVVAGSWVFVPPATARGTTVCVGLPMRCRRVTRARGLQHAHFGRRELLLDFGDQGLLTFRPGLSGGAVRYFAEARLLSGQSTGILRSLGPCGDRWLAVDREGALRDLETWARVRGQVSVLRPFFFEARAERAYWIAHDGRTAVDLCAAREVNVPRWPGRRSRDAWLRVVGARGMATLTPYRDRYLYQYEAASARLDLDPPSGAFPPMDISGGFVEDPSFGAFRPVAAVFGDTLWLVRHLDEGFDVHLFRSAHAGADSGAERVSARSSADAGLRRSPSRAGRPRRR